MNILKYITLAGVCMVIASCGGKDPVVQPDPEATVLFSISNTVKGGPISRSTSSHTNAAGNTYKIDLLKYYVTNITLVDDKGMETNYKNYNLIDAFDVNSTAFLLPQKVVNGNYRKLVFYVGVDQERNHSGAQEGALSASNGMLWTWTFGYIFYKLEGYYTSPSTTTAAPYRNHLGTDSALTRIEIPILMDVKGVDRKINLNFDIDKVMGDASNKIDLDVDKNRQSDPGDEVWMAKMETNISGAFAITGIE
jgi:hypothetical protein